MTERFISLAESLGTLPPREQPAGGQDSSKLNSNLLESEQVAKQVKNNLLELKQVLSKLKSDLLESEQVENDLLSGKQVGKQVIGFRLQLASEPEQVSKQQKGGRSRAAKLSPARRREIDLLGVEARRLKRSR